jgi:hypothetical protein
MGLGSKARQPVPTRVALVVYAVGEAIILEGDGCSAALTPEAALDTLQQLRTAIDQAIVNVERTKHDRRP